MNNIFVQIASYRDPQLIPTLNDLIEKAKHPQNLEVVVCWQNGEGEDLKNFVQAGYELKQNIGKAPLHVGDFDLHELTKDGAKITLIDVDYTKAQGACWARNAIQQLYADQKYTFQLDSHHRFVKDYDQILIDMLEGLRAQSPKPLITAYIPSFDPDNDPNGRVNIPWKMDFDRFIPEGAVFFIPSTIDNWKEYEGRPMRARFYSAHFAFADGCFAEEVQHDPEYFFHGEEISIAARAYTHGYDLYHPTVLVAWHEYTRKNRVKVWDDHTTTQKIKGVIQKDWVERNNECHARNRTLFGMDGLDPNSIDFGKYGFGTARTLLEYEQYAGLSFKYRGVQQETLDKKEPPNSTKYENEEQWKESFVRSNDIRVCFHKSELSPVLEDYDFWYVGCHDENDKEIYRKDALPGQIVDYLRGEFVDFRLIFLSNLKPKTYTVWAHSSSKGWVNKITKIVTEH